MLKIWIAIAALLLAIPMKSFCAEMETLKTPIRGGAVKQISPNQLKSILQSGIFVSSEEAQINKLKSDLVLIKRIIDDQYKSYMERVLPTYQAKLKECTQKNYTQQDMLNSGCGQQDTLEVCSKKVFDACLKDSLTQAVGQGNNLSCYATNLVYLSEVPSVLFHHGGSLERTCLDVVSCGSGGIRPYPNVPQCKPK